MNTRSFVAVGALLVAIACRDDTTLPVDPGSTTSSPIPELAASALAFYQVSGGTIYTCGLTTSNRAYCWGYNGGGELGDGTTTNRTTPVPVAGGLQFRQITTGNEACAVTTGFRAYCWGSNQQRTPALVPGGRRFRTVSTAFDHTCGVSYPDYRAYCWGDNSRGQLGDGTITNRTTPVAVAGTLRFRQVSVGWFHTCGVTTEDRAFCWGWNRDGQIGDGSTANRRLRPTAVAGGHQFRQLDAGDFNTCAVTTGNRAFCWGNDVRSPKLVPGGLSFERVSTERFHTCGETTSNRAYCWGSNGFGQLGDGTTTERSTPVAVAGGLLFRQLSVGDFHTCAKTSDSVAYCWGYNFFGQLGDGTTTNRSRPTALAGPS